MGYVFRRRITIGERVDCEENYVVKLFYNIFIYATSIFVFWADLCSESFERRAS